MKFDSLFYLWLIIFSDIILLIFYHVLITRNSRFYEQNRQNHVFGTAIARVLKIPATTPINPHSSPPFQYRQPYMGCLKSSYLIKTGWILWYHEYTYVNFFTKIHLFITYCDFCLYNFYSFFLRAQIIYNVLCSKVFYDCM